MSFRFKAFVFLFATLLGFQAEEDGGALVRSFNTKVSRATGRALKLLLKNNRRVRRWVRNAKAELDGEHMNIEGEDGEGR